MPPGVVRKPSMDEALQLVIEMNEWTWQHFKADLQDVTP
jgi:hypothetical protein